MSMSASLNSATGIIGTVGPANGGTGLTSYNTGDILYGSATNTLSALPITSTPGVYLDFNNGNVHWYNPFQECILRDDFVCSSASTVYGDLAWTKFAVNTGAIAPGNAVDSAHPGIIQMQTGTNAAGAIDFYLGSSSNTGGNFILGGGQIDVYWVIQIPSLSNGTDRYLFSIGLSNDDLVTFPTAESCVMFEYSDNVNSGNWRLRTTNNGVGTTTTVNTSTAVGTSFTTLRININAAGSLCTFYVNGTSVGTIATNIPTLGVSPHVTLVKTLGTTNVNVNLDLFYLYQYLTNPR